MASSVKHESQGMAGNSGAIGIPLAASVLDLSSSRALMWIMEMPLLPSAGKLAAENGPRQDPASPKIRMQIPPPRIFHLLIHFTRPTAMPLGLCILPLSAFSCSQRYEPERILTSAFVLKEIGISRGRSSGTGRAASTPLGYGADACHRDPEQHGRPAHLLDSAVATPYSPRKHGLLSVAIAEA
jgi:hypothetical protein